MFGILENRITVQHAAFHGILPVLATGSMVPLGTAHLHQLRPFLNMLNNNRKGRASTLSKALLTAGLLGGAALSTLGAGSAQAATGCGVGIGWAAWVGGQTLTCGDKEFTWLSTGTPGNLGNSTVSASEPIAGDYLFNLDSPFTSTAFEFTYLASITDPTRSFSAVDIDSDADAFAGSVLTGTYTFTGGNSPITLQSIGGSSAVAAVIGNPTTITVTNSYNGVGAIDAMENSFQQTQQTVPGPLPLLGAGAAFGFSRQLRKRIRKYTLA